MADYSAMSDADLLKLVQPPPAADYSKMSDADLMKMVGNQTSSNIDAADIAKSGGIGLVKGALGSVGMFGDARELGAKGINLASKALGYEIPQEAASATMKLLPLPGAGVPTTAQMQGATESVTGPFYTPQATAGKYAQTIGEFAPAALSPGGLLRKAAQVVIPAIASEAAGQATEGTAAEPYVRAAAAIAAPVGMGALRRVVTPFAAGAARQDAVNALEAQGVNSLTAGQRTGSRPLQWFEQALGDIPGSGRGASAATEHAAEEFTAAALRQTGTNARRATPEVIDNAFNRIGGEFDRLSASHQLQVTPGLTARLGAVENEYNSLVPPSMRAPVVERTIADIAANVGGPMTGDAYQALRSRLDRAARASRADPQLSTALFDTRNALDHAMEQSIVASGRAADVEAWRTARREYRNMLVVERAATGPGENTALGLISPSQLRTATVGQNRRSYARGQGDFADLARSGEAIMRPLPQSGTAPRSYAQNLPAAIGAMLGGVTGGVPGAALGGMAAVAGPPVLGRLLMSRPVQAYLGNQVAAGAPPMRMSNAAINALLSSAASRGLLPYDQRASVTRP